MGRLLLYREEIAIIGASLPQRMLFLLSQKRNGVGMERVMNPSRGWKGRVTRRERKSSPADYSLFLSAKFFVTVGQRIRLASIARQLAEWQSIHFY